MPPHGRARRLHACAAALLLGALCSGCLMPSRGKPVWLDARAGKFWSG
jgi:hypothetical protein